MTKSMTYKLYLENQITHLKQVVQKFVLAACLSLVTSISAHAQNDVSSSVIINPSDIVDWNICNETSFILRLANATLREGEVKAQGWKNVNPGQCAIEKVARNAPRFLYAESDPVHRGGIREWKGDVTLCAKDEDFISPATDKCRLNNMGTRDYFAVKPDEDNTILIEPSNFGTKAEAAGIQRLLRDAGYRVTAIDGLPGRRTSRSLRAFQKASALETLPEGEALIETLATAARIEANSVGLEICNKSSTRIYAAIGMQEDGNWISRGWWGLDPNDCTRPITQSLNGIDAHYYALKEPATVEGEDMPPPDLRLRSVATIPAQFCIAEAQFSALGREYCLEGGYGIANFRPLPTDQEGMNVSLTDVDFAEPTPSGLRR